MPERGTVLLVESDPEALERIGEDLETAGFEVISCPGPTAPDYTCVGSRSDYCPLVERADVVVIDPWLAGEEAGIGTTADVLVELYAGRGRTVVVMGPTSLVGPFTSGNLVHVGDRPDVSELVAAVRTAPEADGFVLG